MQSEHIARRIVFERPGVTLGQIRSVVLIMRWCSASVKTSAGIIGKRPWLPNVLIGPSGCREQAVNGVVGELAQQPVTPEGASSDTAIVHPLIYGGDVARQIVAVGEVLQQLPATAPGPGACSSIFSVSKAFGAQSAQMEGLFVVCVAGHDAVAIGDKHPLAFGVVGDLLHVFVIAKPDGLKRSGAIVARDQLLALAVHILRIGNLRWAVEAIVAAAGLVGGVFQGIYCIGSRPVCLPAVGQNLICDSTAALLQQVALEVVFGHGQQAGFVVMGNGLAEGVVLPRQGMGALIAVMDTLAQGEVAGTVVARPEFFGPVQFIVGAQGQAALAVAVIDQIARGVEDRGTPAGVNAVDTE